MRLNALYCRAAQICLLFCLLVAASGCDPVTRHKALVSVLDGYPSLPPVEELCREHEERAKAACLKEKTAVAALLPDQKSVHNPYEEKRCNSCHNADKGMSGGGSKDGLLIKEREELCFICHKDLLSKAFQHGPAAIGDCLACHLPHESQYPALLNTSKDTICAKCHTEQRKTVRMHDLFIEKGMSCISCHDPHSGDSPNFLK